jgi:hypothetical protein
MVLTLDLKIKELNLNTVRLQCELEHHLTFTKKFESLEHSNHTYASSEEVEQQRLLIQNMKSLLKILVESQFYNQSSEVGKGATQDDHRSWNHKRHREP